MYHEGSRTLQDRYDTQRIADRIRERAPANAPYTPPLVALCGARLGGR